MIQILAILTAALLWTSNAEQPGSRSCPGGYRHGDTYESGRYWYACNDGEAQPRGCLSESGARVKIEETFDTQENRMQCVLNSDGYLVVLYKSCIFQGREQTVNERYDDGQIWYTCKKDGAAVRTTAIGCVQDSQKIAIKERVAKGDLVYTCRRNGAKAELVITGCHSDGRKYNIGELYPSGNILYTCTDKGGKAVGCVKSDLHLKSGDSYRENDVLYICRVNEEAAKLEPIGCLTRDSNGVVEEKKLDCLWTEGQDPYQYEMTCKLNKEKNVAVKVQTRCKYHGSEGYFNVQPGCYVKVNNFAVGCLQDSAGGLQTKTFTGDSSIGYGLRDC